MKYVFSTLGVLAAGVLLFVSAAMNWQFGYSLGQTDFDGQIYGLASVAADIFKFACPFFIVWAYHKKNVVQFICGIGVLLICIGYSFTSSVGFSAKNRLSIVGQAEIKINKYDNLKLDLKEAKEKRRWVPEHRAAGIVQADINIILSKTLYHRRKSLGTVNELTAGCTAPHWRASKSCNKVLNLRKELAIAKQANILDARITKLSKQAGLLTDKHSNVIASGADPQSAFMARLTGFKIGDIQSIVILSLCLLVEIVSTLGAYIAISNVRQTGKVKPSEGKINVKADNDNVTKVEPEEVKQPVKKRVLQVSDFDETEYQDTPEYLTKKAYKNVISLKDKAAKKRKRGRFEDNKLLVIEFLNETEHTKFRPARGWELFSKEYPGAMTKKEFFSAIKSVTEKNRSHFKRISKGGSYLYEIAS